MTSKKIMNILEAIFTLSRKGTKNFNGVLELAQESEMQEHMKLQSVD